MNTSTLALTNSTFNLNDRINDAAPVSFAGATFAHAASDFPNSQKYLAEDFAGVPENELRAMLVDNCVKYFHLDGRGDS